MPAAVHRGCRGRRQGRRHTALSGRSRIRSGWLEGLMHRGDLVPVAIQGDFGKPRPALIVQSDLFNAHESVTVLPVTSSTVDAPLLRVTVTPSP
ncbi:type II toxin-antitoxin system PemK/MazF family toxin, partial [Vibrio cholerae]|uniref:type II toxin-antitoxin system PemK/MazF family toxin n=1 Tax=Vibrio cholerae TaxID=666 RepID=UPI00349E5318